MDIEDEDPTNQEAQASEVIQEQYDWSCKKSEEDLVDEGSQAVVISLLD